jgi:hypothetical protein
VAHFAPESLAHFAPEWWLSMLRIIHERRSEVSKTDTNEELLLVSKESVELLKDEPALAEIQSEIVSLNK